VCSSICCAPISWDASDHVGIGRDEEAHLDARCAGHLHGLGDRRALAAHVEAALGGALLAALGHEVMTSGRTRSAIAIISGVAAISRLRRVRHGGARRRRHVVVADVAAILAQVRGDPVGAGGLAELRREDRIRVPGRRARCARWRRDRC
jgi:hypothetical protein